VYRQEMAKLGADVYTVAETPQRQESRIAMGFPHIVRIDAKSFRDAYNVANKDDPLAWSPGRTAMLEKVTGPVNDYPRVGVSKNAFGVDDGRHRIDLAAKRDKAIDVAVSSPQEVAELQRRFPPQGAATILDFSKVDAAVNKVAGVKTYKGQNISPGTQAIRQQVTQAVSDWKSLDPAEYHTAEGLDALKQKIGDIRDATQFNTPERVVADNVYHAIRNTIVAQVPEYGKVMKGYEEASKQIKEIERTLSVNPKASVDTALRKILSSLRDNVNTNFGKRKELVEFLARSGAANLLQKIAGISLSAAAPRGLARTLAGSEGISAAAAFAAGHPIVAATLAGGLAASSPAVVGGLAYGAGAATRLPLRPLGRAAFQAGRLPQP
jgi:hypothetical protein